MWSVRARRYAPTNVEVQNAIVSALEDSHETPTVNELKTNLESVHPTWTLSDRRLRLAFNQELNNQNRTRSETFREDDDRVVDPSSRALDLGQLARRSVKRFIIPFHFREKQLEMQPADAAEVEEQMSLEPVTAEESREIESVPVIEEEPPKVEVAEGIGDETREYVDDNNGKKEEVVCAQCIVL